MVLANFHQWSTSDPLSKGLMPSWVGELDANRIAAYNLYEQVYWNVPEAFQIIQRGSDSKPIYIPAAKKIVETLHRYLAKGISFVPDQNAPENNEAYATLVSLLRRERFKSKFSSAKRFGIIRGDWLLHMYADPERQDGSRISLEFIDPAGYFPIYNPDNVDEIIGCHLVAHVELEDGMFIERLTYRKETEAGGPSPITRTKELYEVDEWGGPGVEQGSPVRTVLPAETLPAPIDQLPVYHIRNFEQDGTVWGSSELRGFEVLIGALNQGATDEELTLALEGLGVYATTAGKPINDETGEEEAWNLGPARVVEHPDGTDFKRVTGVSSVAPYQDHLGYIERWIDIATGTPDIAAGTVDVQVAESGVALAMKMAPMLDRAEEKDETIKAVLDNWLFDLRSWYIAYEPTLRAPMESALWVVSFGSKLPVNREQKFAELMTLAKADPPVVPMTWVRGELSKIGYEFADDTEVMDAILTERTIFAQIAMDVTGARMDQELGGNEDLATQDEPGDAE